MFCLAILTVFLYIWLSKLMQHNLLKIKDEYLGIKKEYDKLLNQNTQIKISNTELKNTLEEIIALYDITKQICKSLDENNIFNNFIEQINKYVKLTNCRFIKETIDPAQFSNSIVLPLKINSSYVGYLVADGVDKQDEDKFYILAQQFILGVKRAFLYKKIQEMAITDSLTGIFSRRYYLSRLDEEIERSKKFKYNFAFLMIDIDNFKTLNDNYGHLVGDVILKEVSKTIKENIRQIDLIGRYGGEEFSIIFTETDKEQALFAAERIRKTIEERTIRAYDEDLKVTISIGISVFPSDGETPAALIDKADQALYKAKNTGKNKVCIYS